MANLPPRPESPLRLGPERDDRRQITDERERDRRAAQPMAPRYRSERPERLPERDRAYIPRQKFDSYVPPDYPSRRDDRRDYDDRDRARREYERDRDRRNWERERDRDRERGRDRSPPRRRSPDRDRDRDRRPYDRERGPPRRPPSPIRRPASRRDSRSPPPRRRFSRSPSYRGRNRSRSRSRGPYRSPPSRAIRLGNHSIAASPRSRSSRSPHRRRYSRDRSPISPSKAPNQRPPSPRKEDQKPLPTEPLADRQKEEHAPATMNTQPSNIVKVEEPSSSSIPPVPPPGSVFGQAEHVPSPQVTPEPSHPDVPQPSSKPEPEEMKIEGKPQSMEMAPQDHPEPKLEVPDQKIASPKVAAPAEAAPENKMDVVDSPKPPTLASTQSRGSTPPKPSPNPSDQNRGPPTGPRWGPPPRSPPRGPRNHAHPRPPPSMQSSSSYRPAPRGPRRDFRGGAPSYHPSTPKSGPSLPVIPPYQKQSSEIDAIETEITRLQCHRAHLNVEHFQNITSARRALQDLDIASIELHAAENRRRVADVQLEMAKTGSLGIDAPPITDMDEI